MKKTLFYCFILAFSTISASSQIHDPVKWSYKTTNLGDNIYEIQFTAKIDNEWHLYGINIPEGGPIATSVNFEESEFYQPVGKISTDKKAHVKYDDSFQMEVESFEKSVSLTQKIKVQSNATIKGYIEYMSCNDATCLPPKEWEFSIETGTKEKTSASGQNDASSTPKTSSVLEKAEGINQIVFSEQDIKTERVEPSKIESDSVSKTDTEKKSLWVIFLISMGAGLLGLLTPCVYPMIPMTISFFMQGSSNRKRAVFNGLFFGISIIAVYTLIGLLVAVTKSDFTGTLNTHWIPNILFFGLFLAFAMSFFGLFEIVLPSGFANRVDKQVDKGGLLGPFFMALTTVIVSFSCTGPIVGSLLVKAVQGEVMEPVVGMFGFGLVFALPFTLFAIFPGMVKNLPKSGGWLNSVKIVLGFIVLAFSFKFLANIDQAYHLNIIGRQVFIVLWIVIFTLMGFYLLGMIKFSHDSDLKYISVWRLFFAIASFSFALWLVPGLFGAPLSSISGFLPQADQHSQAYFSGSSNQSTSAMVSENEFCFEPKYADKLHLPHGLQGYFTLEEALKCAAEQNKPVFLDFKGHFCSNCKKMEGEVWIKPDVLEILKNEFIIVALYTDDKTKLPEPEWITGIDGKVKKTMGQINEDQEIRMFGTNSIPLYAVLDTSGIPVNGLTYGYSPDKEKFIEFLNKGIADFRE